MLSKVIEARATARAAVVGLAIGLLALTGLSLCGSVNTQRTTARIDELNEMSDRWLQVLQLVDLADHAMSDYLRSFGSNILRQPLASAAGSARDGIQWLRRNGAPDDVDTAVRVGGLYDDYTETLRNIVSLGDRGQSAQVQLQADQAKLAVISLRKQLSAIIQVKRLETTEYLKAADRQNRVIRYTTIGTFAINLGLVALCGTVLLCYRRRILRQAAKNEHEALHDALTGLANRTLLTQRTEEAIRRAEHNGARVGLLLVDLNRFKAVNDTLGHLCGDRLLQEVAARLTGAVRSDDTVARLGGDEFAVLLPRLGSTVAASYVANRVAQALATPVELDGLSLEVGGSIGVAVHPTDSADADELLKHADIAMYAAKRNRVPFTAYESGLDTHSTAELTLVSDLRRAIDQGELVLHYQPKAVMQDGRISGVEALVRWQHPERGLLGPGEFVPAAEQSGLIEPLTCHVLDVALDQCRRWLDAGLRLPVAVNVGAQCLHNLAFPGQVDRLLTERQVPADMLTLEITESAIITDPARAAEVLARLANIGVRLSIDDFGTGYSSIAYLRTMRVHEMKLDRAFVTHMCSDSGNSAIVRALLDLARNFDLQVVAEGVEDHRTWTVLAALGCDLVQGYYLSKPLPPEELDAWLARDRTGSAPEPGEDYSAVSRRRAT
jgi:diguanylate cyclase (GGDEF)-like protein